MKSPSQFLTRSLPREAKLCPTPVIVPRLGSRSTNQNAAQSRGPGRRFSQGVVVKQFLSVCRKGRTRSGKRLGRPSFQRLKQPLLRRRAFEAVSLDQSS